MVRAMAEWDRAVERQPAGRSDRADRVADPSMAVGKSTLISQLDEPTGTHGIGIGKQTLVSATFAPVAATPGSPVASNAPGQAGSNTGGPDASTRVAEIDRLLSSLVITEEYRAQLIAERDLLVAQDGLTGGMCRLMPSQAIDVISLSDAEYDALTGQPVVDLPSGELPGLPDEAL